MTDDPPFATLAAASCPAYDEMLIAIECEFRTLDRPRVADTLNELARPLFDLRSSPASGWATALASAARQALPDDAIDPSSWLLASALEQRRASAPIRAVLAVELARRAGVPARPIRANGSWLVGLHNYGMPVTAHTGDDPAAEVIAPCTGCLCAHEVAFMVLSGLVGAWRATGDVQRSRRAAGLRMLLPLDADLHAQVLRETLRLDELPHP